MTVDDFSAEVSSWLNRAAHPVLRRPYLSCAFVPMIELLRYLEAHGFTTYIASGGDRDFMRPFANSLYGIPPAQVIGSASGLTSTPTPRSQRCSTNRKSNSLTTDLPSQFVSGAGSDADHSWLSET